MVKDYHHQVEAKIYDSLLAVQADVGFSGHVETATDGADGHTAGYRQLLAGPGEASAVGCLRCLRVDLRVQLGRVHRRRPVRVP